MNCVLKLVRSCWSPRLQVDRADKQELRQLQHSLPPVKVQQLQQFYFEQLPETKCTYNNKTISTKKQLDECVWWGKRAIIKCHFQVFFPLFPSNYGQGLDQNKCCHFSLVCEQRRNNNTINTNTDITKCAHIYCHWKPFNSLWTMLFHWLNVQAVTIIQMPCKCFSQKRIALTRINLASFCSASESNKTQKIWTRKSTNLLFALLLHLARCSCWTAASHTWQIRKQNLQTHRFRVCFVRMGTEEKTLVCGSHRLQR